ncbi:MAG: glutathione S-transferase family protein [Pseudomonadales bacterium]
MAELVVYGTPLSPFVRKVEVVLREKGLEYDFENVNIMAKPDWFIEISPAGRIPVLRDRRIGSEGAAGTIPDSSAICGYLERLVATPRLYPDDAYEHGRALWFEEYADSEMASDIGLGIFRPLLFPRFQGKDSDVATARTTFQRRMPKHFDYLERCLDGGRYLVGDSLSIADIAVACGLSQLDLVSGPPDAARWPALSAHYASLKGLAGFSANLAACGKMLARPLPEKVDLT